MTSLRIIGFAYLHSEEVCQGDEHEANDAPDPEEVSTDIIQTNWSDHDDHELKFPSVDSRK